LRGQERGAISEAVSLTSFGESTCGAPLTDAFSASRMPDSPRTFSDLVEPSPNASSL
jgi:hypothetical protein